MLVDDIKNNEGFRGLPYNDSEGNPTIGYGTLLPITKAEASILLEYRLDNMKLELNENLDMSLYPEVVCNVLYEMSYQMGVPNVLKFKNMIAALDEGDYEQAYYDGKDSLWYSKTPNRCEKVLKPLLNI